MNIMVVSPHPDDETLGAGGTLLKHKYNGDKLYWLNITDMKEEYGYEKERVQKRHSEIAAVKEHYGMEGFFNLELEPAHLEKYDSGTVINRISNIFAMTQPEVIYLPNRSDVHTDHKRVFDWCYSCTKVFRHPYIRTVLTMEILSETNFGMPKDHFIPDYYVDITEHFNEKITILNYYVSELGDHPFPRSIKGVEALAIYRGMNAGSYYAEAFKVIKMIQL